MTIWKDYVQPGSVEEAIQQLSTATGTRAIVSGGTDLLLDMQQGRHDPVDLMIDVSEIPEMCELRIEGDHIILGAGVTHSEIIQNEILNLNAQCVVEGCGLIGGPQVRNVATIGGNVAHALPAGDGTISLLAIGSEAQIATPDGRLWMPIENLFAGPGKTSFDRNSTILVKFKFPIARAGDASAFYRVMRPQGVAIAILNMACWLHALPGGILDDIRLAAGPAGHRPFRARKTEDFLRGKKPTPDVLADAAKVMLTEAQLRTSQHRATAEYRKDLIPVVLNRVFETAYGRSIGEPIVL